MSAAPWCIAVLLLATVSCSDQPRTVEAAAAITPRNSNASTAAVPHGDHRPHYGGVVMMKGDLHFEVVLGADGIHRVYFSDAVRAELPAAVASEVTLTVSAPGTAPQTLRAAVDESGESWVAHGSPLTGSGAKVVARVAFVVNDESYWIDLPYLPAAR